MSLGGKVALVTGGAQGLGKAFCNMLLKNGAKVAMLDVNDEVGQKTESEFETMYGPNLVKFLKCDVTQKKEMNESFESVRNLLGGLDVVINNAGIGMELEDWTKTVDVNLKGTIRGTLLGIESMRKDKGGNGGVIVNISSMAGLNPNPCGPVYGATKAAIIMYSQSWSKNPELAAHGVRINVLAPAFADTALFESIQIDENVHVPMIAKAVVSKVGVMTPEEVAEALYELIEDNAKSGEILTISKAGGKRYHTFG